MAVSDILWEAVEGIRDFRASLPGKYHPIEGWIDDVVDRMDALRVYLDTPPNCDERSGPDGGRLLTQSEVAQQLGVPVYALVRINAARETTERGVMYRQCVLEGLRPLAELADGKLAA